MDPMGIVSFKVPPNPPGRCGFGQTAQIFLASAGTEFPSDSTKSHWLTVKGNKKTGKSLIFDGKNHCLFPVKMFPTKPIQ